MSNKERRRYLWRFFKSQWHYCLSRFQCIRWESIWFRSWKNCEGGGGWGGGGCPSIWCRSCKNIEGESGWWQQSLGLSLTIPWRVAYWHIIIFFFIISFVSERQDQDKKQFYFNFCSSSLIASIIQPTSVYAPVWLGSSSRQVPLYMLNLNWRTLVSASGSMIGIYLLIELQQCCILMYQYITPDVEALWCIDIKGRSERERSHYCHYTYNLYISI